MSLATATLDTSTQARIQQQKLKVIDRPGDFRLIHKDKLHIDPTYQREASSPKVQTIAKTWSWISCGAIIVASRSGNLNVVDGGHRVLAARQRPEITTLPCVVFETSDVIEEAKGFLSVNTQRRQMHSVDKFKAMVVVGDPAAVKLKSLFDQYGYHMSTFTKHGSMGKIACVGILLDCYRMDPDCLLGIWPLLMTTLKGRAIHERVMGSIFYLELAASKQGQSILKQPWSGRIIRLGPDGILAAANKAAAYFARGGIKVWAKGLADALNHGARNKLEVIDIETRKIESEA